MLGMGGPGYQQPPDQVPQGSQVECELCFLHQVICFLLLFDLFSLLASQPPLKHLQAPDTFLKTVVICKDKCLRNKQINLTRIMLPDNYF